MHQFSIKSGNLYLKCFVCQSVLPPLRSGPISFCFRFLHRRRHRFVLEAAKSVVLYERESKTPTAKSKSKVGSGSSGFYSPNLESKSSATLSTFGLRSPSIFDSSFPLYFELLFPLERKFC